MKKEINPQPGKINDKSGKREFTDAEAREAIERAVKTGPNTHRATERGYAVSALGGVLVEPGEVVPEGVPVSENWMERVDGKQDRELARAVAEAQAPIQDDIDLEQIKGDALTAMAAEKGINRGKLGDDKLRDAIRAAYDKDRAQ